TVRALAAWAARHPASAPPEAFLTVMRHTLGRAEEVVAEYRRLGLSSVRVRPLERAGLARKAWGSLGLSPEDYLAFYEDLLGRALAADSEKSPFVERGAAELLCRVLTDEDAGSLDLGHVYSGGTRQLAYEADGSVYLSAEGLDLWHADADPFFRLGGVDQPRRDLIAHPTVRASALASELGSQPLCRQCAYKPYCGVSPVYNYAAQGTIHGRNPTNDRCAVLMGRFDALFARLDAPAGRAQLERWAQTGAVQMGQPLSPFAAGGML
ncbi:MAG: radical SAM domain-containing protein, partial [Elusimicrobia bacterium]